MTRLYIRQLGRQPYGPVFDAMKDFTNRRTPDTPDELWLVEHDPVFTQGQAGRAEHVLMPGDIPVVQVDRGGQVTYHGPGQIVGYPMLDVRRLGLGVRELVTHLEQTLVATLAGYGIDAYARPDAPGVYVDGGGCHTKIASLGIRIRRGCSYHGLALNVGMDLEPFGRINPCGYQGLEMTRIADLVEGECPTMAEVENALLGHLTAQLRYTDWAYRENPTRVLTAEIND